MSKHAVPFVTLLTTCALCALAPASLAIDLTGGTVTISLPDGVANPSLPFTNLTGRRMCDLELSTNDSDGIDPDFQGGNVIVRRQPAGTNLNWQQNPLPGDGVEDIKVFTLDPLSCLNSGASFSVSMQFDGVGSGDVLRVAPTDIDGRQILTDGDVHLQTATYRFFNGFEGLDGSLEGSVVASNGLPVPIEGLVFFVPVIDGVSVVQVTSSLPSSYDPGTGRLDFLTPVAPGDPLDYALELSSLLPYSPDDPDPFTPVIVEAVVADLAIPALQPVGLVLLVLLLMTAGALLARRRRTR